MKHFKLVCTCLLVVSAGVAFLQVYPGGNSNVNEKLRIALNAARDIRMPMSAVEMDTFHNIDSPHNGALRLRELFADTSHIDRKWLWDNLNLLHSKDGARQVKKAIAKYESGANTLKSIATAPSFNLRLDWDEFNDQDNLREVEVVRHYSDVLLARAMLAIKENRTQDAYSDLLAMHRVGRIISNSESVPVMLYLGLEIGNKAQHYSQFLMHAYEKDNTKLSQIKADFLSENCDFVNTKSIDYKLYSAMVLLRNIDQMCNVSDYVKSSGRPSQLCQLENLPNRGGLPRNAQAKEALSIIAERLADLKKRIQIAEGKGLLVLQQVIQEWGNPKLDQLNDAEKLVEMLIPHVNGMEYGIRHRSQHQARLRALSDLLVYRNNHGQFPATLKEGGIEIESFLPETTFELKHHNGWIEIQTIGKPISVSPFLGLEGLSMTYPPAR